MLSGIISLWNLTTNNQKHCCVTEYTATYFVSVLHDMAGVGFPLYDCELFVKCFYIQVLLRHNKNNNMRFASTNLDNTSRRFLFTEQKINMSDMGMGTGTRNGTGSNMS